MRTGRQLEICIDCLDSAKAAFAGGADRLEVCSALSIGGITPSAGLVERSVALGPVMMMIRPHGGSFCYENSDVATMLGDIRLAHQLGVQGVVFGALTPDRRVDREVCRRLIDAARPLAITFHRAFDLTADPRQSLDTLIELGVDRLLTSGQQPTALAGAALLEELVQRAGDRLTIVSGAGVRPGQVETLLKATGVREVHGSASELAAGPQDSLGLVHPQRVTVERLVRALRDELK